MSRRLSLNARLAQDAPASADLQVVLFEITHPNLDAPIRLSTDNTERLTVEPLTYGTRSTWRGADPVTEPFLWIVASAVLPSDVEDAPAAATLILENLDRRMVDVVRSFTSPATVHMAVVLAASPDVLEGEWRDLQITAADIDSGQIALSISREEVEQEHYPAGRMTRDRFPGLHL